MGNCTGCMNIRLHDDPDTVNDDSDSSLKRSEVLGRVAGKQCEHIKKNPSYIYLTEIQNNQKSVNSDELLIRSYGTNSMMNACLGKWSVSNTRSQSSYTGEIIDPQTSSLASQTSASFDMEELRSFDGVNKRQSNRYEIGLSMLKAQIHHGADPKALSTHGERNSLMFAVLAKDFNFIKQLVNLGVDVNQTNSLGETALGLANELQRDDIASYLRTKGAVEK